MNQEIEKDLVKRIADRLQTWIEDSEDLFEMGELKRKQAQMAIISQLLFALCWAIAHWMHPKADAEFVEAFARCLKEAREAKQRKGS